jgi:membrane protease YdiL (CAAX protease family)
MAEFSDNDAIAPGKPPPSPPDGQVPPTPRRRWSIMALALALLAWVVIFVMVLAIAIGERHAEEKLGETAAQGNIQMLTVRAQARYLVGTREQLARFSPGSERQIISQAKTLNVGPIDQRLRYVVLVGELDGPGAAIKALDDLDSVIAQNKAVPSAQQDLLRKTLRQLYTDYERFHYDAPSLSDAQRQTLREKLDWFGKLALAPEGDPQLRDECVAVGGAVAAADINVECPDQSSRDEALQAASRVTWIMWSAVGGGIFFFLIGCVGLLFVLTLAIMGKLRGGLHCGWSPAGVYVETFALWMLAFGGISIGVGQLDAYLGESFRPYRLMASALGTLATLVVLLWPVLRGLSWRQVREDIGWTFGRRPMLEPAIGAGCYFMSFPILLVGIVAVLALMGLQNLLSGGGPSHDDLTSASSPTHPVVGPLASGDWSLRLQLFFLASIVAPIVEETMFRGVLYRHLREWTHRFSFIGSVVFAGLLSSFIFAVIHPQGLLGIPVLMALAIAFVLTREWRGTLVPCMVAHGLNNGLVLMLSIGMLAE